MISRRGRLRVYEHFDREAREAIRRAAEEAHRFNHTHFGTEHLLLGLLCVEEGLAARALSTFGVTLEKARSQVDDIYGYGAESTEDQPPFTPRAKRILIHALVQARRQGRDHIGTEHLLLGLALEGEGDRQ